MVLESNTHTHARTHACTHARTHAHTHIHTRLGVSCTHRSFKHPQTGSSIPKSLYSPMDVHIYRHWHTLAATGAGSPSHLNSWPLTLLGFTPWGSDCALPCGSCQLPSDTALNSKHNTQSKAGEQYTLLHVYYYCRIIKEVVCTWMGCKNGQL